MHTGSLQRWQHDHAFGQADRQAGERRTLAVAVLTAATMAVEIVAGLAFGSMALLADGLHMASHAAALSVAVGAYVYARRHALDRRFSFGTGKVNALAGYSSALMLALFAGLMAVESLGRLLAPQPIRFDQAIVVAFVGLAVNLVSLVILRGDGHAHAHGHHDHAHDDHAHHDHAHHDHRHEQHGSGAAEHAAAPDHNLRGAYLHVAADALTSVLAIAALAAGAMLGWLWPDAAVGLLGAVLIGRWAWGLVRQAGGVLLDREPSSPVSDSIRAAIERDGDSRIADLHLWSVGTGWAAALSVVAHRPLTPAAYRAAIPASARVMHATIEVHRCEA